MSIQNRWRFGGGLLASLTLCLAAHSQQTPSNSPAPPYPEVAPSVTPAPELAVTQAPKRQTIEDLIAAIKAVRAKKAELDRQERALAGELKKCVEEQGKQLAELGITPRAEPSPIVPPASHSVESSAAPPAPVVPDRSN